uniref:Uncharacterized protein n=1 Tax=Rhizophora mucronata TaxID=61149 RepID=A0A2P2M1N0_RHIMU
MEGICLGSLLRLIGHMLVAKERIHQVILMSLLVTLALMLQMLHCMRASLFILLVRMLGLCGTRRLGVQGVLGLFLSEVNRMLKVQ